MSATLTTDITIRNLMLAAFRKGVEVSIHTYKRVCQKKVTKDYFISTDYTVTVWKIQLLDNGEEKNIPIKNHKFKTRMQVALFLCNLLKDSEEVVDYCNHKLTALEKKEIAKYSNINNTTNTSKKVKSSKTSKKTKTKSKSKSKTSSIKLNSLPTKESEKVELPS